LATSSRNSSNIFCVRSWWRRTSMCGRSWTAFAPFKSLLGPSIASTDGKLWMNESC
jgi:hypothetical protein